MGAGATPPGWYPDVERPGGERYWDGSTWTEERRGGSDAPPPFGETPPAFGAPPGGTAPGGGYQQPGVQQQPYQQPGQQQQRYQQPGAVPPAYGAPTYGSPAGYQAFGVGGSGFPKNSVPGWALGLSIAGLVLTCCGGILLSIPGTIMGWTQMKAVDRGEKDPGSRGTAKAAFVVGIVGMSIFAVFLVLYLIGVAVGET